MRYRTVVTLAGLCVLSVWSLIFDATAQQFETRRNSDNDSGAVAIRLRGDSLGQLRLQRPSASKLGGETLTGLVRLRAADGGLMIETDLGEMRIVQPEQIDSVRPIDASKLLLPVPEIKRRLTEELGRRFDTYSTANYVLAFDGNVNHARQVAALLEQLHRGFFAYWDNQHVDVTPPKSPLIVIVFRDRQSFATYSREKIGSLTDQYIGYYDLQSNRMFCYDVPNFERNFSTIIHEATHQLAYNCGLQNRTSDNPRWLSEGLAMFFESPDMRSPKRWRGIGRVNAVNLLRYKRYARRRPSDSLTQLIATDDRLLNKDTAADAYGESWALTYFLIRTHREQYFEYLQTIRAIPPLTKSTSQQRIDNFIDAFGTIDELDKAFTVYMRSVR